MSKLKRALDESDFIEKLLVHDVDVSLFLALSRVQKAMGAVPADDVRNPSLPHDTNSSGSISNTEASARTFGLGRIFCRGRIA